MFCSPLQPIWNLPIHPLLGQRPRWDSFPSLINVGSHNPPLRGPTCSLTHHPVSGSDTICNSPSPPLAYIVLFGFFLSGFPSRFLLGRDFYTLIKNASFSSPTNMRSHMTFLKAYNNVCLLLISILTFRSLSGTTFPTNIRSHMTFLKAYNNVYLLLISILTF